MNAHVIAHFLMPISLRNLKYALEQNIKSEIENVLHVMHILCIPEFWDY